MCILYLSLYLFKNKGRGGGRCHTYFSPILSAAFILSCSLQLREDAQHGVVVQDANELLVENPDEACQVHQCMFWCGSLV